MAVHYPKQMSREVRLAGLRMVTIDCGAGICFQGGCTPAQHLDLVALVRQLESAANRRAAGDTVRNDQLTIPGMENLEKQIVELESQIHQMRSERMAGKVNPQPRGRVAHAMASAAAKSKKPGRKVRSGK